MTVGAFYKALEAKIPPTLSCEWDNDGLSCCADPDAPVTSVLIALDPNQAAVDFAIKNNYSVLLTHHPLLFRGVMALNPDELHAELAIRLLTHGVSAMSFHTRLDALPGGVNDTLAALLRLEDVTSFGNEATPIGRIGSLPSPMDFSDFANVVKSVLGLPSVVGASCGRPVQRVAVLGGAGGDDIEAAFAAGADTYITGEFSYHQLCDAPALGQNLIMAGHYHTEFPVCRVLAAMVQEIDPAIPVHIRPDDSVKVF